MATTLAQLPHARVLLWTSATLAAGALAAAGAAPFVALALVVGTACLIGVAHSPYLFLLILTFLTGIGFGFFEQAALELGDVTIRVNGLRWLLVIAACVAIMLRAGINPLRIPRVLRVYAGFLALAFAGILWSPVPIEGIKQALLFLAPLLIALVALHVVETAQEIERLRSALFAALIVGAAILIVPWLAGNALGGSLDPQERPLNRSFGSFILPVLALALARLRCRPDLPNTLAMLAVFALGVLTLSRTTVLSMLLLGGVVVLTGPWRMKLPIGIALVALAIGALNFGPLRERIFLDARRGFEPRIEVVGRGGEAQLAMGGIDTSGRGFAWFQTALSGLRSPVIGQGTGSATDFVNRLTRGEALYPHNEYLRAWHDWGAIGVAVILSLFAVPIWYFWRLARAGAEAEGDRREWALAALLCWIAFAFVSVFDNVLQYYVFFTHNIFLVTALALRAERP